MKFWLLVRTRFCAFASRDGYHCYHHECRMKSTNVWQSIMLMRPWVRIKYVLKIIQTLFLVDFIFMGFFFLRKVFFRKKEQWCLCHFNSDWCTFVYHSLHNYEPKIKVKSKGPTTRQHWANQDTPWNSVSSNYDEKDCFPFFNFGINSYTGR